MRSTQCNLTISLLKTNLLLKISQFLHSFLRIYIYHTYRILIILIVTWLQDTLYRYTHRDDCYAVVVWRDDEIRAGRERVHTNELVKGDCPSTRKQSHRFASIYPSIGLSLAEHVHLVSPYTFLSLFLYAGILAAVRGCASYLRLTPLCNVQIIE